VLLDPFVTLLDDRKVLMSTRTVVARTLGKLRFSDPAPAQGNVVVSLASLALDACDAEAGPLDEHQQRLVDFYGIPVGGEIGEDILLDPGLDEKLEGAEEEIPEDPFFVLTRSRLQARLQSVRDAFGSQGSAEGVNKLLSTAAQKKTHLGVMTALDELDKTLGDKDADTPMLLGTITAASKLLRPLVRKGGTSAAPATSEKTPATEPTTPSRTRSRTRTDAS
jgi:hypothetical protein